MLAVSNLCGMGASFVRRREATLNLGSCANLELFTWVRNSTGWDGTSPAKFTINIVSGAIVYSGTTGAYSLYIRYFPAPPICDLTIIINGAYVVGMGGAGGAAGVSWNIRPGQVGNGTGGAGAQGGPAIYCSSYCKIANYGVIGAGGGGGGGGGACMWSGGSMSYNGGSGPSGAGYAPAPAGAINQPSSGGYWMNGRAGGVGSLTAGGTQGTADNYVGRFGGGHSGLAGGLGVAGTAGGSGWSSPEGYNFGGGAGGATNYAIYGNGYITWLAAGTRLGWIA